MTALPSDFRLSGSATGVLITVRMPGPGGDGDSVRYSTEESELQNIYFWTEPLARMMTRAACGTLLFRGGRFDDCRDAEDRSVAVADLNHNASI